MLSNFEENLPMNVLVSAKNRLAMCFSLPASTRPNYIKLVGRDELENSKTGVDEVIDEF